MYRWWNGCMSGSSPIDPSDICKCIGPLGMDSEFIFFVSCLLTFLTGFSQFQEVKEENIDANSAYILFYEREGIDYKQYLPNVNTSFFPDISDIEEELETEFKKLCVILWFSRIFQAGWLFSFHTTQPNTLFVEKPKICSNLEIMKPRLSHVISKEQ